MSETKANEDPRRPALPPLVASTLQASLWDGAFFSLMVGLGESYFAAYALSLGLSEVATGQLAVLPIFIAAILQFLGPRGIRWLGSRQRWVIFCAWHQAAALVATACVGLIPGARPEWIFVSATLYWSAGMAAGPAWNGWICAVIPAEHRLRFFATRNRVIQGATLCGLMLAGMLLYTVSPTPYYRLAFSALFIAAAGCRALSVLFLSRQADSLLNINPTPIKIWQTGGILRRPGVPSFLLLVLLMSVSVHWAAPYFTPYMLKQLQLDYRSYMLLVSVAFLARVLSYPLLERLAEARGVTALLVLGAIGIMPSPALWMLSSQFSYLVLLQAYAGICWGAYELGLALVIFERHPADDLPRLYSVVNFLSALGMVAGSLSAAALFAHSDGQGADYQKIFLSSSLARLVPLFILPFVSRPRPLASSQPAEPSATSTVEVA